MTVSELMQALAFSDMPNASIRLACGDGVPRDDLGVTVILGKPTTTLDNGVVILIENANIPKNDRPPT